MKAGDFRRPMPLGVKLKAALRAAGFTVEEIETPNAIEFDHDPALGRRDVVDGVMTPDPNDWRYIVPRRKAAHKAKTNGRKGEKRVTSYGSDVHEIAKDRRLTKQQEEARRRMTAKAQGEPRPRSKWPKRKMQNRRPTKP